MLNAWKMGSFFLLSATLTSCANFWPRKPQPTPVVVEAPRFEGTQFSLPAMGTVFRVQLSEVSEQTVQSSVRFDLLQKDLQKVLGKYELTFSDWLETSELREMEKAGLTALHYPSPLFMKGLRTAKKLHGMTEGVFDITIGSVVWNESEKAVGLKRLVLGERSFRFKKDPKRLVFGGFVKGMVVGVMAQKLYRAGFKDFRISGGDGNEAILRPGQSISFVSRSNTLQGSPEKVGNKEILVRHILDPRKKAPANKNDTSEQPIMAELICAGSKNSEQWEEDSAITDAFTKALILEPSLSPPENCLFKISREKSH